MLLACSLLASGAAAAVTELKVEVYDGPKECEDADKLKKGEHVSMHYTGTIDKDSATGTPGKQFDSSRGRGKTFDFQLGAGRVIQGWDKGLEGLCVGAKAVLTIPPDMGYGERGAGGDIPGGAALSFDVEVVSHSDEGPPEPNLFKDLDTDKDAKLTKEEVLAFFKQQGKEELPEGLWEKEDKDEDGFISWEEATVASPSPPSPRPLSPPPPSPPPDVWMVSQPACQLPPSLPTPSPPPHSPLPSWPPPPSLQFGGPKGKSKDEL